MKRQYLYVETQGRVLVPVTRSELNLPKLHLLRVPLGLRVTSRLVSLWTSTGSKIYELMLKSQSFVFSSLLYGGVCLFGTVIFEKCRKDKQTVNVHF